MKELSETDEIFGTSCLNNLILVIELACLAVEAAYTVDFNPFHVVLTLGKELLL